MCCGRVNTLLDSSNVRHYSTSNIGKIDVVIIINIGHLLFYIDKNIKVISIKRRTLNI
jgi:hypothetical protein